MRALIGMLLLTSAIASVAGAEDLAKLKPWNGGDTPRLALRDVHGNRHDLTQYRGRLVVLNFWATWCGPCVKEMPSLQRLAGKLTGERFALLTVNFGEGEDRVKPFLEKLGVTFTVLLDRDMSASKNWVEKGLPTTFVIDADQKIRYQLLGVLAWDAPEVEAKLRELLPTR